MGTHDTNDDGAMGLPLVALGPDSTRKVDAMLNGADLENARGYHLWSDEGGRQWEWRTLNGSHWWSASEEAWRKNYSTQIGSFWDRADAMANRPKFPPPGFRKAAIIADEQRMADVFQEAALSVAMMRGAVEILDMVADRLGINLTTVTLLRAQADSLESAIARANGGAA